MRTFALLLPLILLMSCSSSVPPRAAEAPETEQQSAALTEACLDNPELARSWGDCNVKHSMYSASEEFAKCGKASPSAKGVLKFELRVRADGKVKSAKFLGGKNGKLGACLSKVMKKLEFAAPPQGKEATITVPYQLAP